MRGPGRLHRRASSGGLRGCWVGALTVTSCATSWSLSSRRMGSRLLTCFANSWNGKRQRLLSTKCQAGPARSGRSNDTGKVHGLGTDNQGIGEGTAKVRAPQVQFWTRRVRTPAAGERSADCEYGAPRAALVRVGGVGSSVASIFPVSKASGVLMAIPWQFHDGNPMAIS